MSPLQGMQPPSLPARSFGAPAPIDTSNPVQDTYLDNYGAYTAPGPLPPTVPATHAHTEMVPRILNSSFSTLAGAL